MVKSDNICDLKCSAGQKLEFLLTMLVAMPEIPLMAHPHRGQYGDPLRNPIKTRECGLTTGGFLCPGQTPDTVSQHGENVITNI